MFRGQGNDNGKRRKCATSAPSRLVLRRHGSAGSPVLGCHGSGGLPIRARSEFTHLQNTPFVKPRQTRALCTAPVCFSRRRFVRGTGLALHCSQEVFELPTFFAIQIASSPDPWHPTTSDPAELWSHPTATPGCHGSGGLPIRAHSEFTHQQNTPIREAAARPVRCARLRMLLPPAASYRHGSGSPVLAGGVRPAHIFSRFKSLPRQTRGTRLWATRLN